MSHPPHLRNGSAVSAFIPFCAFEGQLLVSPESSWLPNLSFPTCQLFTPTSLDGQLCYKLQVNKTSKGSDNREGLLLILDMNEHMEVPFGNQNNTMQNIDPIHFSSNLMKGVNQNRAKIHINTLTGFKAIGTGSYRMTSVKKLTATSDFLSMPQVDRQCSQEDFEDCRRKALFQNCECVPAENGQVQVYLHNQSLEKMITIQGGATLLSRGQTLH